MHSIYIGKLVSGAIAGIVGTFCIYPFDLIKTRLQATQNNQQTARSLIKSIMRHRGIAGMYSGLSANLIGVTPEKAIKLAVNDAMRSFMASWHGLTSTNDLPMTTGMMAGAVAGLAQFIVTNPMEMVKITMQLKPGLTVHQALLECGGIYRGWQCTLARDIPFSMLLFQSNASLKYYLTRGDDDLGRVLVAGLLAGAFAAFAVTPIDVLKTRVQAGLSDRLYSAFKQVRQDKGYRGFLSGSMQRVAIISPLFGISLLAYEFQQQYMHK